MRIGELARRSGVSTRSLRYYERQGLLPARRDANGYRWYEESDLPLVQEIRDRLASGFSLVQTRPFVECLRAGNPAGDSCPDSVAALLAKLDELDRQIAALDENRQRVRRQLAEARTGCARPCLTHPRRGSATDGGSAG
jgi:DNA-binding transcriptional MerR regulator